VIGSTDAVSTAELSSVTSDVKVIEYQGSRRPKRRAGGVGGRRSRWDIVAAGGSDQRDVVFTTPPGGRESSIA
jgi:hypothetical protein